MDAVAFLHRCLEPGSADLIVAADVTVYMRSLGGLMQGAEIYGRYVGRYRGDIGEISLPGGPHAGRATVVVVVVLEVES
jgi:hypothetical protein